MLYPPYRRCIEPRCKNTKLGQQYTAEARIFTLHRGVLPAYETSLYCRHCNTRYHYAYYVQKPSEPQALRQYYTEYRPYVHAHEASFVEVHLCEYFERLLCLSHTSTTNLARTYNTDLGRTDTMMLTNLSTDISPDIVLDAFFLQALLRRCRRYAKPLLLMHNTEQERRLDSAMEEYNQLMAGTGQPQYTHACHDCLKIYKHPDTDQLTFIRGGTTDGVTIGHPCCLVNKCQIRLASTKDKFCPDHQHLTSQCLIKGCERPTESGYITCSDLLHRAKEQERNEKGRSAYYDLSQTAEPAQQAASTTKEKRLTLQTSRNWTHNEQLFVLSCGVIVARSTFFFSEGVASVKEFLKRVFPWPWVLPTHIFYDNACHLLEHLQAQRDTFFNLVRFVVDVFHARNHHKETHAFCNEHTNPALFPELRIFQSKWTLNSSVAEQTNVWFGAFQAITREMTLMLHTARYNFFLDEMIVIRNEWFVEQQERKGKQPFKMDIDLLKAEWLRAYSG
ncbi:hypothetical protein GGX14DRAFT_513671 [Mycena pura]|uniref:CxC6 like cysteine cluster associated with KDZ domain-containing protein n=1 Tax=Mycena pura TaxID=153505 RepID=A0AAD7E0F4_9AGAR|nr:hypothetical protein GGX14DRAFT_514236 [Mycena pura]KAJ7223190.1 hypothetical protein GGX14DRAFT_513671 [Mycena pura]